MKILIKNGILLIINMGKRLIKINLCSCSDRDPTTETQGDRGRDISSGIYTQIWNVNP